LRKGKSGRIVETQSHVSGGETFRSQRSKAELDLRSSGDRDPYVKGLRREKPQACLNKRGVSKVKPARVLPETPGEGETVKGPQEGSA